MTAKTVLIIDDDLSLCDTLEDILQDEGYEPFFAVTYADGLKLAQKQRPKVALLDLKLPDGQGTVLLSDLKRVYSDCLCIIMTDTSRWIPRRVLERPSICTFRHLKNKEERSRLEKRRPLLVREMFW